MHPSRPRLSLLSPLLVLLLLLPLSAHTQTASAPTSPTPSAVLSQPSSPASPDPANATADASGNATSPANVTSPANANATADSALDNDYCAAIAGVLGANQLVAPSDVRNCYKSFQYSPVIVNSTIRSLRTLMETQYVFLAPSLLPPDPTFQVPVDVLGALATISKGEFDSDFSFQEAVYKALVTLNDGHLTYTPQCYRRFIFEQPLFIAPIVGDDGSVKFVIVTISTPRLSEFAQYISGNVVQIDGEDTLTHLQNFADREVGACKDPRTRLANTLASRGWTSEVGSAEFVYRLGAFGRRDRLPDRDNVTYTVIMPGQSTPETFSIPWTGTFNPLIPNVGESPKPMFTDGTSYANNYCKRVTPHAPSEDPAIQRQAGTTDVASTAEYAARVAAQKGATNSGGGLDTTLDPTPDPKSRITETGGKNATSTPKKPTSSTSAKVDRINVVQNPIFSGPGFGFFILNAKPGIGVLAISTFDGTNVTVWLNKMATGLKALQDRGVTKLILDVSGNGGGVSCLSSMIAAILDPSPDLSYPIPRDPFFTRIVVSPVLRRMSETYIANTTNVSPQNLQDFLLPNTFTDPRTGSPVTNPDWGRFAVPHSIPLTVASGGAVQTDMPGRNMTLVHSFSQRLLDSCAMAPGTNPLVDLVGKLSFAGPGNVAVLSDGYCGSACAVMVAHLQEVSTAKVFVSTAFQRLSGVNYNPTGVAFAGGAVVTLDQLLLTMGALGIQPPDWTTIHTPEEIAKAAGIPFGFPTNVLLRFPIRQVMSLSTPDTPLEYVIREANEVIPITSDSVMQPALAWKQMAETSKWMPPSNW